MLTASRSADPYPTYGLYRARGPVRLDRYGFWLLTRHSHVRMASADPRFSNDLRHYRSYDEYLTAHGGLKSPTVRYESNWLSLLDPPLHTQLRALVSEAFNHQMATRAEMLIEDIADRLMTGLLDGEEADLLAEFIHPLTIGVMCHLLGAPREDHDAFRRWALGRGGEVRSVQTRDEIGAANRATEDLAEYFHALARQRRRSPREDLISALCQIEGPLGRLATEQVVAVCLQLVSAGHLPLANLMGNAVLAMLRNPEQLATLRSSPWRISTAVEELARYESPIQMAPRITTRDVEMDGTEIPAGEIAMLCLGSANRDPQLFPKPDDLDIGRAPNRHLAFGLGPHFCLGARLARLELRVALSRILTQLEDLELQLQVPEWQNSFILRGLLSLPLRYRPRRMV